MTEPLVTIVVPSFNQGQFLDDTLTSIFQQEIPVEVFVLDGGSTDNSVAVIKKWEKSLTQWRSHVDRGQAAAINEGVALGKAPYVCWLNSDDFLLPNGLVKLVKGLELNLNLPAVYGRVWNLHQKTGKRKPVWVESFNERRLAFRCIVSQPATLIRRSAWEIVQGVDENLQFSMDYDLWWRLYRNFGPMKLIDDFVAVNRVHEKTKTRNSRKKHYQESIKTVRKHYGHVPLKWWISQPYTVWLRSFLGW